MQDSKLRLITPSEYAEEADWSEAPFEPLEDIPEDLERLAELEDLGGSGRKEKAVKYGLIASVILHVIFFAVLLKMADHVMRKSALRPGEKVTKVRLVELPETTKKDQPPPKNFSAISDRNNIAKKQRLPKISTGAPVPMRPAPPRRMAAIKPPPAPEFAHKSKQKPKPKHKRKAIKPERRKKHIVKKRILEKPTPQPKRAPRNMGLTPTPQERRLALAPRSGAPSYFPEGEVDEAVVDLNTRAAGDFGSYLLHIKRKIQNVWIYPRAAAEAGLAGMLRVEFVIAKNGKLVDTTLLDSSGYAILDETALNAIKTAGPYHPFPPRLKAKRLRVKANFIYHNSQLFGRRM